MTKPKLDAESDFLVKECKTINFMVAGILLAIFLVALLAGDYGWGNYLYALCLFLIPGAIAFAKAKRNATIMTINKNGLYYLGKHITDWKLFYSARVYEKNKMLSIKDNFILEVRFYSPDHTKIYTRSIPLANNQDKAEEEIIEAINFYYKAGN